ncbi:MAG: histidine kinase [Rickettsiales bacterium]|nr:histidine kinase [Rickettsiales bacterium]|tara:strand:- start:181 stop:696 length:516 start_codon:yes stop_codon:yes gene_type:complete
MNLASYPLPHDEAERNAFFASACIENADSDPFYQELVENVKLRFQVPTALVSIVQEGEQWFRAKTGINSHRTGRDVAFCAHAIMQNHVMVVEDATSDMRFSSNPLVTGDTHIRFYAGAPIILPTGICPGTVCIIDTKPRHEFTLLDKRDLGEYAQQVADHIMMTLPDDVAA